MSNILLYSGFAWLLSLNLTPVCLAAPVELQLLGRSQMDVPPLTLSEGDRQWLNHKGTLILGTSAPDYAPFDISEGSDYFEGVTADYAGILSHLLQVEIKVHRYGTRSEVIEALKNHQIDLLGTANAYEMTDPQLAFSSPYALDTPVLVSRIGDTRPNSSSSKPLRLAMLYHYQPLEAVKAQYPDTELQLYASTLSAIGAVAFGQADWYLGDAISANYLINKNYLNNVQLKGFSALEGLPFSLAVSHPNPRLLRLINTALKTITTEENSAILNRWGVNGMNFKGHEPLKFSASEQQWIDQHPRIKVAVSEDFMPLTFFDERGVFSGISADLLAKISLRTGLKFDLVRRRTVPDMVNAIVKGEADLMPSFTPSSIRENVLKFSKPYFSTPFVLITRTSPNSFKTLDDLSGKRVALVIDNTLEPYLKQHFPEVNLIAANNSAQALEMVAKKDVEGAINSLITARYLIKQQYWGQLEISSTVGQAPAQFSMAVGAKAYELNSILDKALTSISPKEMDLLTDRWHSAVVMDNRFWVRNRAAIVNVSAIGAGLLLCGIIWITYLRRLIHKRDQAERALNDQLAFMRALIDGTPHPIYVRDREGRLLICNEGYLDTFGLERQDAVGKTVLEVPLCSAQQNHAHHTDFMRVMHEGHPLVRDHLLELPDGKILTIYHWILPYRGSDDVVVGIIGGWIDISERQQLLEQLRQAKTLADQANLAKSDFLTTMSHEIRTPMNAVIGMLELSQKKAEKGIADSESIGVASEAAHGLLALIGDILDIAQIESGRLSLNPQRTPLMKLVESTARIFEGMAQQKGLQMNFELDPRINTDVLIDPLRLRQVLSNLMSNAIKFTEQGQVRLSVQAKHSDDGERLHICVQVEDTGIGISEQDQLRLFSPFTQARQHNKQPGGSGLGLMISRQLCEMMGGTLTLQSTLGKGTCINMSLDMVTLLSQAPCGEPSESPAPQARPLKILIVDDYLPNRRLLAQQLGYLGHSTLEVDDGVQGLKAWKAQRFDLIMTDCAMPNMDGYELAKSIRAHESTNNLPAILIVGFTANAQTGEIKRCLAAGMNDCLFKPISLHHLEARLANADLGAVTMEHPYPADKTDTLLDLETLERLTHGDANALKQLMDPLISSMEEDMSALLRAFTKHDLPGLSDVAHKVKSGARMIKARQLTQCCENLEQACLVPEWSQLAHRVDEQYEAMTQILEVIEVYRV